MRRCRYGWLVLVWPAWAVQPTLSADNTVSGAPSTQPVAIVLSNGLNHPRLLLTEKQREPFRLGVQRSERLNAGWRYVQSAAHGEVVAKRDYRQLGQVAFVAFVNDDGILAAKGVKMLMAACASPWGVVDDVAKMTEAVATAYDLLYPHLTIEQRIAVRRALIENGIKPLIRNWVDPATASQPRGNELKTDFFVGAYAGSAGLGALAVLGEEPRATEWVRLSRDRLREWLLARGNRDSNETISGMAWSSQAWSFLDALHRITGDDLFDNVAVGCDSLLDSVAWRTLAWREDGSVKSSRLMSDIGEQAPGFVVLCAALTRHRRDATAAWLADRVTPVPRDIRELVWFDESVPAAEPQVVVPLRVFSDIGLVVMRSGWGPDTPAAAITYRRDGSNAEPNPNSGVIGATGGLSASADTGGQATRGTRASTSLICNPYNSNIGSFDLFGGGHPTFVDSGMTTRDRSAFDSHSSQSIASNVVVVDDKPQMQADGRLIAAVSTSRLTAASVQLAAAYPDALKSWTRDLVMAPGGLAIVLDRLEGKGKHRFDYVLHPYQPFKTPYPIASPGEMLIGAGDHPTRAALYSEALFSVAQLSGYNLTTPCKYLRFDSPEQVYNRTYLMVCQWPLPGAIKQHAVDVSAVGAGRWQVRRISEDWRLLLRTGTDAAGKDVDEARLVLVWDQGEKSRERHALLLAARRLGLDNRELMSATRPINAAIEFGRPMWAHFVAAQPATVTLAVESGADYVFLNGKPLDVTRRGDTIILDLPAGESTLLVSEAAKFIPRQCSVVSDDLLTVTAASTRPSE